MPFGLSRFGEDCTADLYLVFVPQARQREIKKEKSTFARQVEEKILEGVSLEVEVL